MFAVGAIAIMLGIIFHRESPKDERGTRMIAVCLIGAGALLFYFLI